MKICTKCRTEQEEHQFYKSKASKDGLYPVCKTCSHEIAAKKYKENAEAEKARRRKYEIEHKEEIKIKNRERHKRTYAERKEKINKRNRESYQRNKESARRQEKAYRERTRAYQSAKARKRQALVLKRIPKCANLKKIEEFYQKARELTVATGVKHEVDHIVPLQGKLVSGFHVEWNLQILTKSKNSSKGHSFKPFIENYSEQK